MISSPIARLEARAASVQSVRRHAGRSLWRIARFSSRASRATRTTPQHTVVTVPTPEQARGNFGSINIYDPTNVVGGNRQQFAGNVIPEGRLDPVGRKIAALYPAPNQPGLVNNYASLVPETDDANQYDFRGDHNFSERDKLFARLSRLNRHNLHGSFVRAGNCGAPGPCR